MHRTDILDTVASPPAQSFEEPKQTLFRIMISADAARRDGFEATADALLAVASHLADVLPPSDAAMLPKLRDRCAAARAD